MRVVCQRVTEARVRVGGEIRGEIGPGLVALVGIARGDDSAMVRRLAAKVARLRVFEGDDGRFDRSVLETGGSVLAVSEFTLIADTSKATGPASPRRRRPRRPSRCGRSSRTRSRRRARESSAEFSGREWTSSS